MSRWTDRFNNHEFRKHWNRLLAALGAAKVNDETVPTDVAELGRLKRVVSYVDGLIRSLDPELVPASVWNNFLPQAQACADQVEEFNSTRVIGHIQNANENADNLLTYVRPYMVVSGRQAKNLRDAAAEYINVLSEYVESFRDEARQLLDSIESFREDAESAAEAVAAQRVVADDVIRGLVGSSDAPGGTVGKFNSEYEKFSSKYKELIDLHSELLVGGEDSASVKDEVAQALTEVKASAKVIKEQISSVNSMVSRINEFDEKVFGKADAEGGRQGGLDEELAGLKDSLSEFDAEQKRKYSALVQQVEDLIPGATSAGLASAYGEMRASFDKPIQNASRLFYAAIGSIVVVAFITMTHKVWIFGIEFSSFGNLSSVAMAFLHKLPLIGPLVWLGFYASKRRSECQRLQQEYAHKEALAKSYESYKRQIIDLGGERSEMLGALIEKAVDAIVYNASTTLDGRHGDSMPLQAVVDKLLDKFPDPPG